MFTLNEVVETVRSEFLPLFGKFMLHDLTLDAAAKNTESGVNKPGVYVFWKDGLGVIKVGKSQSNAKVRSLQHIRDNTRNEKFQMSSLANDSECHLLLFTVSGEKDIHWLLALSAFASGI